MLTVRHVVGRAVGIVVISGGLAAGISAPAIGAPDVPEGCWAQEYTDDRGYTEVSVICPPGVGHNPATGGGPSGDGDAEPIAQRQCAYGAFTVECQTSAGVWNGSCYVKVATPQPAFDHPVWGDHDDGVIIQCTAYDAQRMDCDADGGCPAGVSMRWAAGPPDAGPSPAELARRAVAQMQLAMGEIGSTPPESTTSSFVGLPIWLWVTNPSANTVGPLTASASERGVSVTATATLDRIDYIMRGEGGTVAEISCARTAARGTPYEAQYGDAPSPTCGLTAAQNQRVGLFTITGTAHWVVEWSGGGQAGTIPVALRNSIQMDVGEIQVVRTG